MENIPATISKTIDVLADKFGSKGVDLWNLLVWGKQMEGLGGFLLGIIFLFISLRLFKKWKKLERWADETPFFTLFFIIGTIVLSLMGFILICANFVGIIAPQYALIMEFIK